MLCKAITKVQNPKKIMSLRSQIIFFYSSLLISSLRSTFSTASLIACSHSRQIGKDEAPGSSMNENSHRQPTHVVSINSYWSLSPKVKRGSCFMPSVRSARQVVHEALRIAKRRSSGSRILRMRVQGISEESARKRNEKNATPV